MGDRVNNMGKMMNNPKQRNIVGITIGAAVILIGGGIWVASKNNGPSPSAGAVVVAAPQVVAVPGSSDNPQYNKSIKEANDLAAQQALASDNKSFVPTLTNGQNLSNRSPLDEIDREKQRREEEARKKSEEDRVRVEQDNARMQEARAREVVVPMAQTQVYQQAPATAKKGRYGPEDYALIAALSASNQAKMSNSEFDYAKDKSAMNSKDNVSMNRSAAVTTETTTAAKETVVPFAKAGTIFNAVLETAINSDEPSPVLAKIVSGDLKGTRLIGQLQTVGEKVVIQFATANIPQFGNSVRLSAFAVDPNTSRTALADDVNHHYFLRYGVMLAASFLGGYADAISRQNTITSVSPFGGATVTQGQLSNSEINKSALGSVGKAVATNAQQQFQNLKPTITVNSGSPIGILLVDDLVVKN